MSKRRNKGRELSRSKRKKEGHRHLVAPPVASAVPQPAAVVAAVPLETAPPVTRPETPPGRGAASLVAELKRVGLFGLIALAVLVVLALTLG